MAYRDDHPTNFVWHPYVKKRIDRVQVRWPWKTFINTYFDHPPGFGLWPVGFYDKKSFDVWGGGRNANGQYTGYRGKPLPRELGHKIFDHLFKEPGPAIDWIIWNRKMWWNPATGGPGWMKAPWGPPDSDPGHVEHIHCTLR